MLGWSISIYRETDCKLNPSKRGALRLASWTAGLGGLDWLDRLVELGQATVDGNGYPFQYSAKARIMLPCFTSGPPIPRGPVVIGDDYILPAGYLSGINLQQARIEACSPDEILIAEAWDQS